VKRGAGRGRKCCEERDEQNENNDNNRNENDDDTEWTERDRATGEKDESDRNVLRWSAQSGSSI
jgi:hypothetical protein